MRRQMWNLQLYMSGGRRGQLNKSIMDFFVGSLVMRGGGHALVMWLT